MTHSPSPSTDDRIRALTEELRIAEAVDLANASKTRLILNQERLRGALADSLRLIGDLLRRIEELEEGR